MKRPNISLQQKMSYPKETLEGKDVLGEMNKIQELMNKTGFKWWFSAGTVLGLVREERGYILHDTDIDFEVLIKTSKDAEAIDKMLMSNGYKVAIDNYLDKKPSQLAFFNPESNILLDIYFYMDRGEKDFYVNYCELGMLRIPKKMVKNKELFKKGDYSFMIPSPVTDYLTFRYGTWMIPKTNKGSWVKDVGEAFKRWD